MNCQYVLPIQFMYTVIMSILFSNFSCNWFDKRMKLWQGIDYCVCEGLRLFELLNLY